jgi:PAS domain S-box-containing protein
MDVAGVGSGTFDVESRIRRYGFAVVAACLGVALRFSLASVIGPSDLAFLLAYPAVAAAAWVGGLGPGVLCSLISIVAAEFLFFDPAHGGPLSGSHAVAMVVFFCASLLIGLLGERSRRAIRRLTAESNSRLAREAELRLTNELLRVAEQGASQLAAIVTSSDDAIISKNLEGMITSWNAAATRMFGYAEEEIVGRSILTLIPPELQMEEVRIQNALARGEPVDHFETVRLRKNGEQVHVSISVSPIRDRAGRVIGASKIARDITQHRRVEQALRKTEMEAAKGRLAAAIAHEINNPLEAITNLGYLITRAPELNDDSRELVAMLNAEVARVSEITRQALAFYRENAETTAISVNSVLEGVLELFRRRLEQKAVRLEIKYGDKVPRVTVKTGELRQVFSNLLANALDATGADGVIVIRSSSTRDQVRITFSDNGHGIPRERRELIFKPFETTKGENGTGLGLWVSKGLVEKYGGRILFRSSQHAAHQGTSFTVVLPRPVMEHAGAA